jgi:hypothetical protein
MQVEGVTIPFDAVDNMSVVLDKVSAKTLKLIQAEQQVIMQQNKGTTSSQALAAAYQKITAEEQKATTATAKETTELKNQISAVQGNSMKWTELSSVLGLVRQGLQYVKQGYDFAKEGAEIEFQKERFDRLAVSIDTTSDVLLGQMKEASRGTLSDMEAMGAATDLMSLGLAKTAQEAVRLSKVQTGLAMDTNNLVLTLTNMRTMRFDQLGVSVDGFKERLEGLKKTMQGASEQDIFKEAFLQQAEMQLERVGNAADSSAGQFKIFEAEWKNMADGVKVGVATALTPALVAWNNMVKQGHDEVDMMEKVAKANNMTYEEFIRLGDGIDPLIDAWKQNQATMSDNIETANQMSVSNEDLVATQKELSDTLTSEVSLIKSMQSAEDSYTQKSTDLTKQRADAEDNLSKLRAQGYWEQSDQIQNAIGKVDEIKQKEADLAAEREKQSLQFVSNILAENLARDGWTENEFKAFADQQEAWGLWSADTVAKAEAAMQAANDVTAAIEAIPSSKDVTINVHTKNSGADYNPYSSGVNAGAYSSGFASGTHGWETVPAGYPNDTYPIRLTSGEKFAVVPASSGGSSSGGNYAGGTPASEISDASIDKLINRLETALQRLGT